MNWIVFLSAIVVFFVGMIAIIILARRYAPDPKRKSLDKMSKRELRSMVK